MTYRILQGDAIERLREMPEEHFHCCVTSPPYWGLRKYLRDGHPDADKEMGSEKLLGEYLKRLLLVFREVRRVLRDDGTCWVNLGMSYASGGRNPSQSPLPWRAPAYDSGGRESQDSQVGGHACRDSCGELQDETQTHHVGSARTGLSSGPSAPPICSTGHDSAQQDCLHGQASSGGPTRGAQVSTTPSSDDCALDAFDLADEVSVCRPGPPTYDGGVMPFSRMDSGSDRSCTLQMWAPLAVRTAGKMSFVSACDDPSCLGVGRCGLCWINLAIPSLQIKSKDLIDVPGMFALAMQADGWYWRSVVAWTKRSAMPESVRDRPTASWEPIFLFSKKARYFYDAEAVREQPKPWNKGMTRAPSKHESHVGGKGYVQNEKQYVEIKGANLRNVWPIPEAEPADDLPEWNLGPEPCREAHFATFPTEIPRRAILAGTSAKGCCPECGAPWGREVERISMEVREGPKGRASRTMCSGTMTRPPSATTLGWRPTCDHGLDPVPCQVLDPFAGAGTTLLVAEQLGHDSVGIELNPEYIEIAERRLQAGLPVTQRRDPGGEFRLTHT